MPPFADIVSRLKSKGFRVQVNEALQRFRLDYYGVVFEVGLIEFYSCRNMIEVLNLARNKYRAAGGSMKVQILRVADDKSKAEFVCIQIEAYPGDIRWQCGKCSNWGAWVRPELGAICQKRCGAKVCYVERQNMFGQRLVDQYDKSGTSRRYFIYMDDKGQVQIKPDSDDKPDPKDFKDIQQTMQEQIERVKAADKLREERERAAQDRLRMMEIVNAQRQAEIAADRIGPNMLRLRDYQVSGTMMLGPIPSSPPVIIEKKKRPKKQKEKQPKPAETPKPGVRRFRGEFPE